MKRNLGRFESRLYVGYALRRFYWACFKYGHCIMWCWAQFKNTTSSVQQTSLAIATSARWQTVQTVVSVFVLSYFHLFGLSPTLTCGANASTKGSQPTCDESARKRVFGAGRATRLREKKSKIKTRRKISRARHPEPVLLSRWFLCGYVAGIRADFSRGLLARRDVGAFYRDADIPRISQIREQRSFFVNAKQYCDNAIPHNVKNVLQRQRLRSTVYERSLESNIRDGYRNELHG